MRDFPSPVISEYARINPPQDVVDHYATLKAACDGWPATALHSSGANIQVTREARICDQITGRMEPFQATELNWLVAGVIIGMIITAVMITVSLFLGDVYRGLRRLVCDCYARRVRPHALSRRESP